jgi:hypothetical protein
MSTYEGIIDLYDMNFLDLEEAFDQGIRLILHQASRGLDRRGGAYARRKKALEWDSYEVHTIS